METSPVSLNFQCFHDFFSAERRKVRRLNEEDCSGAPEVGEAQKDLRKLEAFSEPPNGESRRETPLNIFWPTMGKRTWHHSITFNKSVADPPKVSLFFSTVLLSCWDTGCCQHWKLEFMTVKRTCLQTTKRLPTMNFRAGLQNSSNKCRLVKKVTLSHSLSMFRVNCVEIIAFFIWSRQCNSSIHLPLLAYS